MPPTTQRFQTRTAVLAILCSVAALSLGDAVIKATGLSLPLWQMFILRSALVVPVLGWLIARRGPVTAPALGWSLLRSVLLVLMWLSYYAALPLMPLSLAAAAYYTGPLFIVILVALAHRRWPARRAIVAVALGFAGVVLIIRPDTSGFSAGTLLPILAAVLYACAMVLTAAKCRNDDPLVLALLLNLTFVASGALLGAWSGTEASRLLGPWQPLDLRLFGTIALLSVFILIGSVGAAMAYQKGPTVTVAAFDYSYLIFSLIWGSLFFAERPGFAGLIGLCVILGAGLLALPKPHRPQDQHQD